MYERVKKHPNVRQVYTDRLVKRKDVEAKMAKELAKKFKSRLQSVHSKVKNSDLPYTHQPPEKAWSQLNRDHWEDKYFSTSPETGVALEEMKRILHHLTALPEGFDPVNKVNRLYNNYEQSVENDQLDWALGELSAYATLLLDGHDVRMSGQDVRRGTFSHRHAVLKSQGGDSTYNRLDGLAEDQGKFHIYNSLLSEYAVLGFEYGYSTASPQNLVLWEAQFGDFANGAMTIFDQFISSGESKWGRMSGLTVLLPHGYEGQGPEHSSARLERFLQLCAEFNMVVANPTMPANMFHLLRRQLAWDFRKPLIVMSPKSGLRHDMAVSSVKDFGPGTRFQEIIDDPTVTKSTKKIKRVLLCSGKVYFDLAKHKAAEKRDDIAIVRIEQLFPLAYQQLADLRKRYADKEFVWVQEESRNAGAWNYISEQFNYSDKIDPNFKIRYVGRPATASPATGFKSVHVKEQQRLIEEAFA
jgi:2-oxoglutarate dehydrogenase E1 component